MNIVRIGLTLCFAIVLFMSAIGCSQEVAEGERTNGKLMGKVSLDSNPVLMGFVVVQSKGRDSRMARGAIFRNGRYVVENAPDGPVTIFLELPPMPPGQDPRLKKGIPGIPTRERNPEIPSPETQGMPEDEKKAWDSVQNIPKRYFSPQRSMLVGFVKPGDTTELDLELTSTMGPPDPADLPGGPPGRGPRR